MPEFDSTSGEKRGVPVEFKAAAAETSSTTHNQFDTGQDGGSLHIIVNVTAASGTTPTLYVVVEGSQDGGTTWFRIGTVGSDGFSVGSGAAAGTVTNFTAAATARAEFPKPQLVRTRSVVGGTTPSFTYSVEGVLH